MIKFLTACKMMMTLLTTFWKTILIGKFASFICKATAGTVKTASMLILKVWHRKV